MAESAGTLRVVEVDPVSDPRWGRYVAEHPHALVYHQPGYLGALAEEYGERPVNLACEDAEGRLRGVLPLMQTRGVPFKRDSELVGRRLSSLPRTPVAGPVADDAEATSALLRAATEHVRADGGRRLQLKLPRPLPEAETNDLTGGRWIPAFVVDLPESPDDLRFGNSKHHGRIRSTVRRAAERGVEVHTAEDEEDLRTWYRLYLETMRWHAIPARPYRFFAGLWNRLRPNGTLWLLLASRTGGGRRETLAGSLCMSHGDTVYYAFNARTGDALKLGCNDAIQWRALHDACGAGFRHYDMGEATGREIGGVGQFKTKWGARTYDQHRYYFPPVREQPIDEDPASRLQLRDKLAPVWRRIPLRATGYLGDRFNRYL